MQEHPVMDSFLEEQLKRIQELTRRMSGLEHRSAELSEELARDRLAMRRGPLQEIRDLRTVSPIPRAQAHHAPRRRRRKRS
jgi:hypothetical protein